MDVKNSDLPPEVQKHFLFFKHHPELSFKEHHTTAYIIKHLRRWKIDHKVGLSGCSIIAKIQGQRPEVNSLLLRCEMDAVRISTGQNGNPVAAHLCGHDSHMAIMLSLIHRLNRHREKSKGTILILFQTGEETLDGAKTVISDWAQELSSVDMIFGLHMVSDLPIGSLGIKEGPVMASGDQFHVIFKGRGGHASSPHKSDDLIMAGTNFVQNLYSQASRCTSPFESAVISIAAFQAGDSPNVLPDQVTVLGTIRALNEITRHKLQQLLRRLTESIAAGFGITVEVILHEGPPVLKNSTKATKLAYNAACRIVKASEIVSDFSTLLVDDFAYYLDKLPGAYVFVGCGESDVGPLHSTDFKIGQKALALGYSFAENLCNCWQQSIDERHY